MNLKEKSMPKKIINGYWDGEPIWRWETAQEQMTKELNKVFMKPELETIIDNLTFEQEEILTNEHHKNYHGCKEDWEDSFNRWLMNLTLDEIKEILKV